MGHFGVCITWTVSATAFLGYVRVHCVPHLSLRIGRFHGQDRSFSSAGSSKGPRKSEPSTVGNCDGFCLSTTSDFYGCNAPTSISTISSSLQFWKFNQSLTENKIEKSPNLLLSKNCPFRINSIRKGLQIRGNHKIVHFAYERNFHMLRNHTYSTHFEPFNISQKFRNHQYSTLFESSNFGRKARNHRFSTLSSHKVYLNNVL